MSLRCQTHLCCKCDSSARPF